MAVEAIRVTGLTELIHGFEKVDHELGREVRNTLKEVGEVVKVDAEHKAVNEIRNLRGNWAKMRLGVSRANVVYIVPADRRSVGPPRKNLGALLMDRAMEPAAEEGRAELEHAFLDMVNNLNQNAGLVRSLHNI